MKFTAPTNDIRPRRRALRDARCFLASPHRSATIERSLFGGLAVAAACLAVALVVHGSEPNPSGPVESGWSISSPPSALDTQRPTSPQLRIAINQMLDEGHMPLLQAPSQQRPKVDVQEAADGWRPAHLPAEQSRSAAQSTEQPSADERESTNQDITPVPSFGQHFRSVAEQEPATVAPETEKPAAKAPIAKQPVVEQPAVENAPAESKSVDSTESESELATSESKPAEEQPAAAKPAPAPLPPLSQNMKNLRAKVRRVLKSYYSRPLNTHDNDPWESMHGMLAYGVHSKIRQGSPSGKTITLVGWLCYNRPLKGMTLLYTTPENELRAKQGVGLQGHMGQFLAMLAQCQVSPQYPIRVRNQEFTIQDLIAAEQETCYPKSELTFKLIALMHYLDSDATWVNDQGASWDIPRLIREELAQPIRGAACGGTHRLSGLSLAARTRVRRGEPLDGEYLRAAQFVEKYHSYAYQMQNRDGSLSTEWFRGRGAEDDTDRRVKTTGHILEWLCYSVNDKEIRSVRTFRAVNYLSSLLASNFDHEWEVGPLSHAIHALRLYDERVYQPYDALEDMAKKAQRKTAQRYKSKPSSKTSSTRSTQQR
jgi:hypothetical protein